MADVKFSTEYSMSFADSWYTYQWFFWIGLALTACIAIGCTVTQSLNRPGLSDDPYSNDRTFSIAIKLVVNLLDLSSKALFCYLLATTGRLFIFFKM